jgi:2'-5' RNA ligase
VTAARRPARTIGVAIPVPEPYGEELRSWRSHFGDPMAALIPTHVTLLGPTTVEGVAAEAIDSHLAEIARCSVGFTVQLLGTGTFRPVSQVVFVQVAEGISDCERMETQVRSGPLQRESRFPFHPHVTVAHDVPDERLDAALASLRTYNARFSVGAFSVYEHGADQMWRREADYVFGEDRPRSATTTVLHPNPQSPISTPEMRISPTEGTLIP